MRVPLRFHHSKNFIYLSEYYKGWRESERVPPTFDELYKYPTVGKKFIAEEAESSGRMAIQIIDDHFRYPGSLSRPDNEEREGHKDYVGTHGQGKDRFVKKLTVFYQMLLLTPPDNSLNVSYDFDGYCNSCERKYPKMDVGIHCINSYGDFDDFLWDRTLQTVLQSQKELPHELRDKIKLDYTNEGRTYIFPIGIFRTDSFISFVRKTHTEVDALMYGQEILRLISVGVLARQGELNLKITEKYRSGEIFY